VRVGRIRTRNGALEHVVVVDNEVFALQGDPFGEFDAGARVGDLGSVNLATPLSPGKIVCVGLNYLAHVTENDPTRQVPDEPVIFMKPPSALVAHRAPVRIAYPDHRTDYEAELAVVIRTRSRNLVSDSALDAVLGYTCANDVSDRTLQKKDGQWVRAKGFDTYCPLGPWIETDLDLDSAIVSSKVNGEQRQSQGVATMLFPVIRLLEFISGVMTLEPGDVILTGTPEGVGPLQDGDTVEVSVTGIGSLVNPVETR
jgi:2-keto-4-pentenoate hydratase/2-oxohepta-3-ene-1,7-dioic acid hydratase in catechol pathway